ncbi:MAG: MaoC/PaaZ C-terminal domain-containing protein [Pseudomonadota bacterium]
MNELVSIDDLDPPTINSSAVGSYTIANTELLEARRISAFAAGVYEQSENYFDDTRRHGLAVHPAIAFSLQWNARFRLGVASDSEQKPIVGVHAGTDFVIHKPFRVGRAVTTQGRLIAFKQVKSGVFSVERYRMTDASGDLLAELDINYIILRARLTGGDVALETIATPPALPVGVNEPAWSKEIFIPFSMPYHYTACADIFAPIHTSKRAAQAAGFPNIILHGSATKAIALGEIINARFDGDPTRIKRLYGQLRGIVSPNTHIRVQVTAVDEVGDDLQVFFQVLNENDEPAVANGLIVGRRTGVK